MILDMQLAFLFIVYTNDKIENSEICKIIEYADDTVVVGLSKNNDESHDRNSITYVTDWCDSNYLNLNVAKTKKVIMDFRRMQTLNHLLS